MGFNSVFKGLGVIIGTENGTLFGSSEGPVIC